MNRMSSSIVMTGHALALAELDEAGQAHHLAVLGDDLGDRGDRGEPGEPHQVDGGLGVAVALAHAAVDGAQRQDVAGPDQARRASRPGRRARAGCARGRRR